VVLVLDILKNFHTKPGITTGTSLVWPQVCIRLVSAQIIPGWYSACYQYQYQCSYQAGTVLATSTNTSVRTRHRSISRPPTVVHTICCVSSNQTHSKCDKKWMLLWTSCHTHNKASYHRLNHEHGKPSLEVITPQLSSSAPDSGCT